MFISTIKSALRHAVTRLGNSSLASEARAPWQRIALDPRVPRRDNWLPSGIAGRVGVDGRQGEWVIARSMLMDMDGTPDAYRLFLPTEVLQWGEWPEDYVQSPLEDNHSHPGEAGFIDLVSRTLEVDWDTSPEAWNEACAWFRARDDDQIQELSREEKERLEWLTGRNLRPGPFDVGPYYGPTT
ncbi:hypothetical protein [Clavibacter michiganensis]|uniref:hypothetical protein n=1 Tax=Clavibacter michiganensis TaxID=28447 RepID=UPI001BDF8707|nr:hypothetical protein [Clavibacter michiganensis]MBT1636927.1 hypothetical protein [Clavibacter michiganensis]